MRILYDNKVSLGHIYQGIMLIGSVFSLYITFDRKLNRHDQLMEEMKEIQKKQELVINKLIEQQTGVSLSVTRLTTLVEANAKFLWKTEQQK